MKIILVYPASYLFSSDEGQTRALFMLVKYSNKEPQLQPYKLTNFEPTLQMKISGHIIHNKETLYLFFKMHEYYTNQVVKLFLLL